MRFLSVLLLAAALALPTGCKNRTAQAEKKQEALKEIATADQELKESLRKGLSEDGLVVDHEVLAKQQKAMEAASKKLGGATGGALQVLAGIQAESNQLARTIEKKSEEFLATLDWASLEAENDFAARRETLQDYAKFNQDVITFFDDRPEELRKRLDKIGFKGSDRDDLEGGFKGQFAKINPMIRLIRECDITGSEIAIRMLNLLETNKGKWSWNTAGQRLEFKDDATETAFLKEAEALQEVGAKQVQLQTQMVNRLR